MSAAAGAAAIVADTAYDSDAYPAVSNGEGKEFVVKSHTKGMKSFFETECFYALCDNAERFFFYLKRFSRITSRYVKLLYFVG